MGRKRLLAVLASAAISVTALGAPALALEAGTTDISTTDTGAADTGAEVPLPADTGEVSVDADLDGGSVTVTVDLALDEPSGNIELDPDISVVLSDTPDVEAALPMKIGPIAADPVGDLLDAVDDVAGPVLDTVAPPAPGTPPVGTPDGTTLADDDGAEGPVARPASVMVSLPRPAPSPISGPRAPVSVSTREGGLARSIAAFDWGIAVPEVAPAFAGDGILAAGPFDAGDRSSPLEALLKLLAASLLVTTALLQGLVGQRLSNAHRSVV